MNRIAICEVYHWLEIHWNISGVLQERKSNIRRNMSSNSQLNRMSFKNKSSFHSLSNEQYDLYLEKLFEYELIDDNTYLDHFGNMFQLVPINSGSIDDNMLSFACLIQNEESLQDILTQLRFDDSDYNSVLFNTETGGYTDIFIRYTTPSYSAYGQWYKVKYIN